MNGLIRHFFVCELTLIYKNVDKKKTTFIENMHHRQQKQMPISLIE